MSGLVLVVLVTRPPQSEFVPVVQKNVPKRGEVKAFATVALGHVGLTPVCDSFIPAVS